MRRTSRVIWMAPLIVWLGIFAPVSHCLTGENANQRFRLPDTLHFKDGSVLVNPELVGADVDALLVKSGKGEQRISLSVLDRGDETIGSALVQNILRIAEAAGVTPQAGSGIRLRRITGNILVSNLTANSQIIVFTIPPPASLALSEKAAGDFQGAIEIADVDKKGNFELTVPVGARFSVVAQVITWSMPMPKAAEWRVASEKIENDHVEFRVVLDERGFPVGSGNLVPTDHLSVTACATAPTTGDSQLAGSPGAFQFDKVNYSVVTVFYGTDRKREGSRFGKVVYGGNRGELALGSCEVSIPANHHIGELETKSRWKFFSRSDDPEQYVLLLGTRPMKPDAFFEALRAKTSGSGSQQVLVFVHGYNVTFEDAARRTGQMAADLNFKGAALFFSWPSQGVFEKYPTDEVNIEWSEPDLRRFLELTLAQAGAKEIFLIAHSMGNRALTRALGNLANQQPAMRNLIKGIILAAPDIDADVFKRDIAPGFLANEPPDSSRIVTLYASTHDRALAASKKFHTYARAGDCSDRVVYVPGIETIDASAVDTDLFTLGHSYFGYSRSVLSDIHYLITEKLRAEKRFGLRPIETPDGTHWVIRE